MRRNTKRMFFYQSPVRASAPVMLLIAALLFSGDFRGGFLAAAGRKDAAAPDNSARTVNRAAEKNASRETAPGLYWRITEEKGGAFVVDGAGNRVPVTAHRRIVVISPGAVEVLYMIGAESAIAGVTSGRDPIWPEEKTVLLPDVGNTARPSLEAVIALEPDLVIGNGMTAALMADLASRGYAVLLHNADSLADIFNSALILGSLTGKEAEARTLVAEKKACLDSLKTELKNKPLNLKGAFLYSANPVMAFTSDSLPGEILDILGVENIAAGLNAAQPILSPEYILSQNPDFLFGAMGISKPEDILAADSAIAKTRAGIEKNISIVPSSLFLRASPRIVESLLELYGELKKYAKPGAAISHLGGAFLLNSLGRIIPSGSDRAVRGSAALRPPRPGAAGTAGAASHPSYPLRGRFFPGGRPVKLPGRERGA